RHALLLADDRDDRLMVELGVVKTVEEMDRTRARRRHADSDVAGQLGVRGRGEGGDLLVARLGELELVADLVEGAEQAVDPVARIRVDALDAPFGEAVEDELGGIRHVVSCSGRSSRGLPTTGACKRRIRRRETAAAGVRPLTAVVRRERAAWRPRSRPSPRRSAAAGRARATTAATSWRA